MFMVLYCRRIAFRLYKRCWWCSAGGHPHQRQLSLDNVYRIEVAYRGVRIMPMRATAEYCTGAPGFLFNVFRGWWLIQLSFPAPDWPGTPIRAVRGHRKHDLQNMGNPKMH